MNRRLPAVLVVALGLACAACGGEAGDGTASSATSLARDYVQAIDDEDGERVCALLTEEAAKEFAFTDRDLPCARTVVGLIGYVEDSASSEFLSYERIDAKPGPTQQGYTSVRLSLEARFHTNTEGGYFEVCRFEDTVWFTREGDGWRIAKPSLALYAAFGARQFSAVNLAPPGTGAHGKDGGAASRLEPLSCRRDAGVPPAPADGETLDAASVADRLAEDEDHFTDVRCIDAAGRDGWDFVCTYLDPARGERMKAAYALEPAAGGTALVGGGSVPEDSTLLPRP